MKRDLQTYWSKTTINSVQLENSRKTQSQSLSLIPTEGRACGISMLLLLTLRNQIVKIMETGVRSKKGDARDTENHLGKEFRTCVA